MRAPALGYCSRVHPNAALITRFYEGFQRHDAEAMAACYTPDVLFSDPAFGELRGPRAGNMWRMLTGRAADLVVTFRDVEADDHAGRARRRSQPRSPSRC